jgi:DNA-binding beta-propeller fold protein YncE
MRRTVLISSLVALAATVSPVAARPGADYPAPDYAVTARIPGADGGWDYASVDPVRGRLYVARADAVMAVDLATGTVTAHLAAAQRAHAVLPIDNGATIVQTDGNSGLTRFLDAATGAVKAEVATGRKPDSAYFDSATGFVVVMNPGSNAVTLIDPKSHALVRTIAVTGGLEEGGGDGHGHAFVNLEEANALAEVDLVAGTLMRTIALTGCDGPTGLAVLSGGTRVLSACANGVATVVDAQSGKLLQMLPVGHDPDAVIVDTARALAFVPSGRDGNLTAIAIGDQGASPVPYRVVGTTPTQVGARTGALDPRTGRIYLPTTTMLPPQPGQHRSTPKPGSFVVLVVSPKG